MLKVTIIFIQNTEAEATSCLRLSEDGLDQGFMISLSKDEKKLVFCKLTPVLSNFFGAGISWSTLALHGVWHHFFLSVPEDYLFVFFRNKKSWSHPQSSVTPEIHDHMDHCLSFPNHLRPSLRIHAHLLCRSCSKIDGECILHLMPYHRLLLFDCCSLTTFSSK